MAIVEALLTDSTLVVDKQFVVVPKTHINWEQRHTPAVISAPVFLYHVLVNPPYRLHMSYLWSRPVRTAITPFEAALPIVYGWFADAVLNPPKIDLALRFGRGCVQEVLAYAAHQLRLVYRDLREYTAAMDAVVATPWHVTLISPFSRLMHRCMKDAPIPVEVVAVGKKEPDADIVLEHRAGYLLGTHASNAGDMVGGGG